jgi:site-specific DNA-methyltransferase (adenine-specific)/modification methylase
VIHPDRQPPQFAAAHGYTPSNSERASESGTERGAGAELYRKCVSISNCTLYLGDCNRLRDAGALKAQALVTDPPYGINYIQTRSGGKGSGLSSPGTAKSNTQVKAIHGDDEPFDPRPWTSAGYRQMFLLGANHYAQRMPEGGEWLVWDKSCGQGSHSTFRDAEFAWSSTKTPRNIYRHLWLGCIRTGEERTAKDRAKKHPSQKPVALMLWAMEAARVAIGSTVCDPFMGSGSTAVACLRSGRSFVGVEIDEEYFRIACERIQEEADDLRLTLSSGAGAGAQDSCGTTREGYNEKLSD